MSSHYSAGVGMSLLSVVVKAGTSLNLNGHWERLRRSCNTCYRILRFIQSGFAFHIKTLYLFTEADVYTYLIPILLSAWALSPSTSLSHLVAITSWTWIHLLQYRVAAHASYPTRGTHPPQHRLIPPGRITDSQTRTLQGILIPAGLTYSIRCNVSGHSLVAVLVSTVITEVQILKKYRRAELLLKGAFFIVLYAGALGITEATVRER